MVERGGRGKRGRVGERERVTGLWVNWGPVSGCLRCVAMSVDVIVSVLM